MMKKKLIALLLIASMAVSLVACGGGQNETTEAPDTKAEAEGTEGTTEEPTTEEPKEPVEISLWFKSNFGKHSDQATVLEAVNEYIEEKINVKISDFQVVDMDAISLELATTDNIDLIWTTGVTNFQSIADQGGFLDLTELLPNYETLYNTVTADQWAGMAIGGKQYGVPVLKEAFSGYSIMTPVAMAEQVKAQSGVDFKAIELNSVRDLAKLTPYLDAVAAINKSMVTCDVLAFADAMLIDPEYIHINSGVGLEISTGKIVDLYALPEYEEYVKLMYEWGQKGYQQQGRATGQNMGTITKPYLNAGYPESATYGIHKWSTTPDNVTNACSKYGFDVYMCEIGDRYINNSVMFGSVWGISGKCDEEEADACLKFLELLNTDEYLATLWAYGVKDKHYTLAENGQVERIAESGYAPEVWTAVSVFAVPSLTTEAENKAEIYGQDNAAAKGAATLGFRFDTSNTSAQVAGLKTVASEYVKMLQYGLYDESKIADFLAARKTAGVDAIIADMQAQYDAWVASK